MTCASCAARIEKRLGAIDGVEECSVNLATHEAAVAFDPARVQPGSLVEAVEETGYHASLPTPGPDPGRHADAPFGRLALSALLPLPLALVAMVPALHFSGWEWLPFGPAPPGGAVGGLASPPT